MIYAPQHVHHTDHTRFSRDHLPKHPLEDDSGWYLDKPDNGYVNLCDAGRWNRLFADILHYPHPSISRLAYRGDLQTLLKAFKKGIPVDITDKFMKTPLMVGK